MADTAGQWHALIDYYGQHRRPWGYGDFDEDWESLVGQHMHWSGGFASMLFLNHWEYTKNVSFARSTVLPLVMGLLDFWGCYLTNGTLPGGSSSTESLPSSSSPPPSILQDWPVPLVRATALRCWP